MMLVPVVYLSMGAVVEIEIDLNQRKLVRISVVVCSQDFDVLVKFKNILP